ncbi:hypothetical protein ON010_g11196 [Phytophthora cinnamomi]|nr:hypothetical protein ON010_g11196 [Phytophthora cinnamomi]
MYNTQKRIGGDAPLSPLGVQYAEQLDRFIDAYYPTPDTELAVWTSTMLRTGGRGDAGGVSGAQEQQAALPLPAWRVIPGRDPPPRAGDHGADAHGPTRADCGAPGYPACAVRLPHEQVPARVPDAQHPAARRDPGYAQGLQVRGSVAPPHVEMNPSQISPVPTQKKQNNLAEGMPSQSLVCLESDWMMVVGDLVVAMAALERWMMLRVLRVAYPFHSLGMPR